MVPPDLGSRSERPSRPPPPRRGGGRTASRGAGFLVGAAGGRARRPGLPLCDRGPIEEASTTRRVRLRRRPVSWARRARGARGATLRVPAGAPPPSLGRGGGAGSGASGGRDAQAGVPSAGWPRAQLAFKDSMVRGILQFTPGIAFRYVLHRCESRDIRCRESCGLPFIFPPRGRDVRPGPSEQQFVFLGAAPRPEVVWSARGRAAAAGRSVTGSRSSERDVIYRSMILPQVHLRKPCYDFYFL